MRSTWPPPSPRRAAVLVLCAVVVVNLFVAIVRGAIGGDQSASVVQLVVWADAFVLAFVLYRFACAAERAMARTGAMREKGRRVLEEHLKIADLLAKAAAGRPTFGNRPHLMRIEVMKRFFHHSIELDLSETDMRDLIRDVDPIAIRDVVETLVKAHSPLMDETSVPWAAAVKAHANKRSDLCHKPTEILAWKRSLPRERIVPEA